MLKKILFLLIAVAVSHVGQITAMEKEPKVNMGSAGEDTLKSPKGKNMAQVMPSVEFTCPRTHDFPLEPSQLHAIVEINGIKFVPSDNFSKTYNSGLMGVNINSKGQAICVYASSSGKGFPKLTALLKERRTLQNCSVPGAKANPDPTMGYGTTVDGYSKPYTGEMLYKPDSVITCR